MARKEVPRWLAEYSAALRTAAGSRSAAGTSATARKRKQKVRVDLTRSQTLLRAQVVRQSFFFSRIVCCLIYLAALIAYYLDNFSPFMVKFGSSFGIRWYGFSYLLAFFCGFLLLRWLAQRRYCALPPDKVGDFILAAALGVVVGGRLGYVLFYRPGQLLVDPLFVFRIWDGGMSSHGGMIGLTLAVFLYGRRHHVPWLSLADNIAVVAPVGLFLGRCANFINGELYGRPRRCRGPCNFQKKRSICPKSGRGLSPPPTPCTRRFRNLETMIEQARTDPSLQSVFHQTLTPRHPSQLYEALLEGAFLFGCLWFLRLRTRQPRGHAGRAFPAALRIGEGHRRKFSRAGRAADRTVHPRTNPLRDIDLGWNLLCRLRAQDERIRGGPAWMMENNVGGALVPRYVATRWQIEAQRPVPHC